MDSTFCSYNITRCGAPFSAPALNTSLSEMFRLTVGKIHESQPRLTLSHVVEREGKSMFKNRNAIGKIRLKACLQKSESLVIHLLEPEYCNPTTTDQRKWDMHLSPLLIAGLIRDYFGLQFSKDPLWSYFSQEVKKKKVISTSQRTTISGMLNLISMRAA